MSNRNQGLLAHCDAVRKAFRGHPVLDGVDLQIHAGEAVGLLGANGAGKTTLLNLISGLMRPTSGRVELAGGDPTDARHRTILGAAPQALSLPETARVGEVINFVRAFYRGASTKRELIREFELGHLEKKPVGALSGGQKRLLSLALAFAGRPQLVLLDEPTTGLDAQSRELLWDRVNRRIDEGTAVVVTSHHLEDIQRLARRAVILRQGRVAVDDAIETIQGAAPRMAVRVHTSDAHAFAQVYHLSATRNERGVVQFITDDVDRTVQQIVAITGSMRGIEVRDDTLSQTLYGQESYR